MVIKMILKILKFFFSKEIEVAPGVFWLGGTLYENRNKPTTPRPLKLKRTPEQLAQGHFTGVLFCSIMTLLDTLLWKL
jgi:hypothetical protein